MSDQFDDGGELVAAPEITNYQRSATLGKLAEALSKAQGVIEGAKKDTEGQVGTARKKYADLASVWAACKAALSANGISVIQVPTATAAMAGVSTLMAHASGEWVSGTLLLPVQRRDAQGMGSAITYARRYALMAFVGVAPEDDDGDAAVGQRQEQRARPKSQGPAPAPQQPKEPPPTGEAFAHRLHDYEGKLVGEGVCKVGELIRHVADVCAKAGHGDNLATYGEAAVKLAAEETKKFEAAARKKAKPRQAAPEPAGNGSGPYGGDRR